MTNTVFIPELIAAGVQAKLGNAIKLYPLSYTQDLQNEKGGDVITVPKTQYVGDATVVAAGQLIPVSDFTQSTDQVTVKKYAKAVSFNEEEVNSAYSDVQVDAEEQLTKSIANGIEKDMYASLNAITGAMLHTEVGADVSLTGKVVANALAKFGEDLEEEIFLLVNATDYASLRQDEAFDKQTKEIYGATVMPSNRVAAKTAFLVKAGAVGAYIKKDVLVETEEDISNQTHLVVGTELAAVHLRDESKAVKIVFGA